MSTCNSYKTVRISIHSEFFDSIKYTEQILYQSAFPLKYHDQIRAKDICAVCSISMSSYTLHYFVLSFSLTCDVQSMRVRQQGFLGQIATVILLSYVIINDPKPGKFVQAMCRLLSRSWIEWRDTNVFNGWLPPQFFRGVRRLFWSFDKTHSLACFCSWVYQIYKAI